jgi:hypothetical protein
VLPPRQAGATHCKVVQLAQPRQRCQVSIPQAAAAHQGQKLEAVAAAGQQRQQPAAHKAAIECQAAQAAARGFQQRRQGQGRWIAAATFPTEAVHIADIQVLQATQQQGPLAAARAGQGGCCQPQQSGRGEPAAAGQPQLLEAVRASPDTVAVVAAATAAAETAAAATTVAAKANGASCAAFRVCCWAAACVGRQQLKQRGIREAATVGQAQTHC